MAREKLSKRELAKRIKERKKKESVYMTKLIKESYKRYEIKFRWYSEKDIIEHLASKPSVQAYIKELIRKDIGKQDEKIWSKHCFWWRYCIQSNYLL